MKSGAPVDTSVEHISPYKKIKELCLEFYGFEHARPRNTPLTWSIELVRIHSDWVKTNQKELYGLQYRNPENSAEFIKVMPANKHYIGAIFQEPYLVYHFPSKRINQELQGKTCFDRNNLAHQALLDSLSKSRCTERDKAKEARQLLGNFYFSVEDLNYVRQSLGLEAIPSATLNYIRKLICDCHYLVISKTQGGMMYKHRDSPYFSTRIGYHTGTTKPFVKVGSDRGFHTATGAIADRSDTEAHINLDEVLWSNFDWHILPCTKVFALNKFDYSLVHTRIE